MAYPASIPTKPAYKQRWDGWADSIDAAVRELIVDVPPMKTQVTQATTRVSQAESAITGLQSQQATTSSTASTALSTAQSAATSAGAAQQSAQTAQAAASQAATDAAASASQVSGLSSTVSGHTTQIGALESGKAATSALATVAFTGKYVDLIGAPTSTGGGGSPYSLVGVAQAADGTWELSKAEVDALRPCKAAWFEDAAADQPLTAAHGALDGDIVNGWPSSGVYPVEPEPSVTYVSITAPTAVDEAGVASDRVVLTAAEGVAWTVAGTVHDFASFAGSPTKTVPTGGSLSIAVTATPEDGYAINPGHTTTWTLTFTDTAPATVLFEDDFGTTALTEAEFLARTTPTGGKTVVKTGTGAVSVNASGQLVIDATGGSTGLEWSENSLTGSLIMDVVAVTGLSGSNSVQMWLRGYTNGYSAVGHLFGSYFRAQVMDSWSTDTGTSVTSNAPPRTYTCSLTESGTTLTLAMSESGNGATSTHSKVSTDTGPRRARIYVPTGAKLTLGRVRKESA